MLAIPLQAEATNGPDVISFTLVNSKTGQDIGQLQNGAVIDLAQTDYFINIRANTDPVTVGSVEFGLNDDPGYNLENEYPYHMDGDNHITGDPYDWYQPLPGPYTLSATAFTGSNGYGTAGSPLTISFTVIDTNPVPVVEKLALVDESGSEIRRFGKTFGECAVIDLATMPDFSIEAVTEPAVVGSLEFDLNDYLGYNLEEEPNYYLDGKTANGAISTWTPIMGQNVITATAYSGDDHMGHVSADKVLNFTVVNSNNTAVPASTGSWEDVRTFLLFYGCYQDVPLTTMAQYDALIFEPTAMTPGTLAQLKALNPDIFLLGYVSIGETNGLLVDASGNPLDIYFLDGNGNPIVNPNWGSYYVDARKPLWHDLVLNTYLPNMFAMGFDGAFLDTVDTSAYDNPAIPITGSDSAPGMANLLRSMDTQFPNKLFVPNRGFHLLRGGANDVRTAIDGLLFENFTAVWYSTKLDANGANIPWYHVNPADSYEAWWTADMAQQLNRIRYVYNADGTVQRDANGQPVRSSTFFNVLVHDYALPDQTANMQAIADRAWDYGLIPSMSEKQIEYFTYNWLDLVQLPSASQWAAAIDFTAVATPSPYIDRFDNGVANWAAFREDHNRPGDPTDPYDMVALADDNGAARLDFTVQGQGIAYRNSASLRSPEWFTPIDLTNTALSFQIKLDVLPPTYVDPVDGLTKAEKAVEVWLIDHNNDVMAWSVGYRVTTANQWTTITLPPGEGIYYGAWDGAKDGFQWDQVRAVQFRVANAKADSPAYTGSMWVDDVQVLPWVSQIQNGAISNTTTQLTLQYDYNGSPTTHYIFLDTDQNPATGFTVTSFDQQQIGADYLILAGAGGSFYTLYSHDPAAGNGWGWNALPNVIMFTDANNQVTAVVDRAWIGETGDPNGIDVVFAVEDGSLKYSDRYTHVYTSN